MSWGTARCDLCQWVGLVRYLYFGSVVLFCPDICRKERPESYQIGTACKPSVSNMDSLIPVFHTWYFSGAHRLLNSCWISGSIFEGSRCIVHRFAWLFYVLGCCGPISEIFKQVRTYQYFA